jgi:hypothetical protein
LPLYHEVLEGNTTEVTTIKAVIEKIVERFPIKHVIAVADRGFLLGNTDRRSGSCLIGKGGHIKILVGRLN